MPPSRIVFLFILYCLFDVFFSFYPFTRISHFPALELLDLPHSSFFSSYFVPPPFAYIFYGRQSSFFKKGCKEDLHCVRVNLPFRVYDDGSWLCVRANLSLHVYGNRDFPCVRVNRFFKLTASGICLVSGVYLFFEFAATEIRLLCPFIHPI